MDVRAARADDYETFARLFPELGSGDPVPARRWWESTLAVKTLFIEHAGSVIGYGLSDPYGESAHVSQVVVDGAWRGRGVGRRIMGAVANRLRAAGCARWQLNVKEGNLPAQRLYERFGLRVAYRGHAFKLSRSVIAALPRRDALSIRLLTPDDDSAIESLFGLAKGQLTARRTMAARSVQLLAQERGSIVGFAAGDAAFPGANLLRAAQVDVGVSLLRDFFGRLDTSVSEMHTFIEDNEPLATALHDAGATVKFVALHMKGTIPPVSPEP